MCFNIPKKIKGIKNNKARLETGEQVDIGGLSDCQVGDYILHTGQIAIEKVDLNQALEIRAHIKKNLYG